MVRAIGMIWAVLALTHAAWAQQDAVDLNNCEGLIVPSRRVQLNAPMTGILAEVIVEEGDAVAQGQVLARMDDRLQQLTVEAARQRAASEADVQRTAATLAEMQIMLERAQEVYEADAASEWEVRRARLQRDQAKAEHQAAIEARELAQTNLKLEEQKLAQHRVVAPFDGRVVRIEAEGGGTLTQRDPILSLVALDPLEAEIYMPVTLYGELKPNASYRLHAEAPIHAELVGELIVLDPVIDSASRTFRCIFRIANPDSTLPAGATVRLASLTPVQPHASR